MLFRKKPKVEDKTTKISKSRQFNPRIFMTSLVIFAIAIAVSFIVLSIIITQYTYFILAGSFSISAIVGVLTISKNWEANESTKYLLFAFLIEISITLTAAIFTSFSGHFYCIPDHNYSSKGFQQRLDHLDRPSGGNRFSPLKHSCSIPSNTKPIRPMGDCRVCSSHGSAVSYTVYSGNN
jgi:hypothetical protein